MMIKMGKKKIKEMTNMAVIRNLFIMLKVKIPPLQAMKAQGGCGCKGPHIHSHGTMKR